MEQRDNSQSFLFEESHSKILFQLLKEISFFRKSFPFTDDLQNFIRHSSDHFHCENFLKGSIIFNIGDQADKFYLILQGRVGVFIPKSSEEIHANKVEILNSSRRKETFFSPQIQKTAEIVTYDNYFLGSSEHKRKYFEDGQFIYKMIKALGEKECFGELALSNNKLRSATILALENITVLTLLKQDFERDFERMIKESQQKFEFFQKLFEKNSNSSSSTALMRLIYYFNELELLANQTIFHEGEITNAFYVIVNGEIEICKSLSDDNNKITASTSFRSIKRVKTILNIAKLGSFSLLGEEDLIEEREKRSYTAVTITKTKLYVISKKVKIN